jgi:hypothetical protein
VSDWDIVVCEVDIDEVEDEEKDSSWSMLRSSSNLRTILILSWNKAWTLEVSSERDISLALWLWTNLINSWYFSEGYSDWTTENQKVKVLGKIVRWKN